MRKIDATLARIRLLLSEVEQREAQTRARREQFVAQRARVLQASLYGEVDLTTILAMLDDIERKLDDLQRGASLLGLVRQRAEQEYRSLSLTRQAEDAKAEIVVLNRRLVDVSAEINGVASEPGGASPNLAALRSEQERLNREIKRLWEIISEVSDLAARTFEEIARLSDGKQ